MDKACKLTFELCSSQPQLVWHNLKIEPFQYEGPQLGAIETCEPTQAGHRFGFFRYVADNTWLVGCSRFYESVSYWANYYTACVYAGWRGIEVINGWVSGLSF